MMRGIWHVLVAATSVALLLRPAVGLVMPRVCYFRREMTVTFGKKKGGKKGGGGQKQREMRFEESTKRYAYTLAGLTKKVGDRKILDKIDLAFYHGAKIGLVGSNGSGKSTLMKVMAGVDKEFEGVAKPGDGKVGYLAQEPVLCGETVEDAINPAIESSRNVLARFEELTAQLASGEDVDKVMAEMESVQNEIDARNLWELDRRVELVLDALRCPDPDARINRLSGGERRRVAIARLILENNDFILLDEPTNHLDAESIAWLEGYLADTKATVVVVTHDRYFLDRITKWVLELDSGRGLPFEGSYAQWLGAKLKSVGDDARRASSLKAELECFAARSEDRPAVGRLLNFDAIADAKASGALFVPKGPRLGVDVIRAENLGHAFGNRWLFNDLNVEIPRGAIVGVVGPNGAGKSTLVELLSRSRDPTVGTVQHGQTVVVATAAQSRDFVGNKPDATVFEAVADGADFVEIGGAQINARQYLGWFGFSGAQQSKPVSTLSGGERNRAYLCRQLRTQANVLFLDEPTNDLDVATLRALEDALLAFAGTIVVVSHDRFFLDRIATHILAFEPSTDDNRDCDVVFFYGNWQQYDDDRRLRLGNEHPKALKFNRNQLVMS